LSGEVLHRCFICALADTLILLIFNRVQLIYTNIDPDDPSFALSPKSENDLTMPLRHPKNRSHEDHRNYQEELQQWQEYIEHMKNTYAIFKELIEEDEALVLASKLGLAPNGELKSIFCSKHGSSKFRESPRLDQT
jgi:uncharacterized protein YecE (DUF72 family)